VTPRHHPSPETLIGYVAGTLPNAISCVVACHVSLCGDCADQNRRLAILGGLMLNDLRPGPEDEAFTERAAAQVSVQRPPPSRAPNVWAPKTADPLLPVPLTQYLGISGAEIPWKRVVKGVRQYWVKLPPNSGQIRLLRLTPGKLLLEHSHTGMELTLVLQGVYGDHTGDYVRGDVIEWTEGTTHQPRASGDEECVCLIASERTPYFTRLAARLLRPIMGF
jgi:putative transcriptional regulator